MKIKYLFYYILLLIYLYNSIKSITLYFFIQLFNDFFFLIEIFFSNHDMFLF
jgi:hypothetical protein